MDALPKKEFFDKLKSDKVKINWNKNPIRMDVFLTFITVPLERSKDHLGYENGWTMLQNKEHKLIVGGGIVGGVEYLDRLQFGVKLSNPYNNYVNPFYMFDVMTDEGKAFFVEYYKEDIAKIVEQNQSTLIFYKKKLEDQAALCENIGAVVSELNKINK